MDPLQHLVKRVYHFLFACEWYRKWFSHWDNGFLALSPYEAFSDQNLRIISTILLSWTCPWTFYNIEWKEWSTSCNTVNGTESDFLIEIMLFWPYHHMRLFLTKIYWLFLTFFCHELVCGLSITFCEKSYLPLVLLWMALKMIFSLR